MLLNKLVGMTKIQGVYSVWTLAKHLNDATWKAISYKIRKPSMELAKADKTKGKSLAWRNFNGGVS